MFRIRIVQFCDSTNCCCKEQKEEISARLRPLLVRKSHKVYPFLTLFFYIALGFQLHILSCWIIQIVNPEIINHILHHSRRNVISSSPLDFNWRQKEESSKDETEENSHGKVFNDLAVDFGWRFESRTMHSEIRKTSLLSLNLNCV